MSDGYTFIFLGDPQPDRNNKLNGTPEKLSELNRALNDIGRLSWPAGSSLAGQPIAPQSVVIGGDLCQCGGDYDPGEQFFAPGAAFYMGGWELQMINKLYREGAKSVVSDVPDWVVPCTITPTYFGLGNHDIQTEFHPGVSWLGTTPVLKPSEDYWRYQMWNFIAQMHVGHSAGPLIDTQPKYPVTRIDGQRAQYGDWQRSSFNYWVDAGPADIFQLHRHAVDAEFGRADNLDWLKKQLAFRGPKRPLIVVQHYPFQVSGDPQLSSQQREEILDIFAQSNVVAFLAGHIHDENNAYPLEVRRHGQTYQEFRPGAALGGIFGLVHVSASSFDFVKGAVVNGQIQFARVFSKPVTTPNTGPLRDGVYTITMADENRALDVAGASQDNGALVLVYEKHGGPNQRWRLTWQGGDMYRIEPMHVSPTHPTGMALDLPNWTVINGMPIIAFENKVGAGYKANDNQLWHLTADPSGRGEVFSIHPAFRTDCCLADTMGLLTLKTDGLNNRCLFRFAKE